eukprot:1158872-Pelagomonas_calceolata.AAC.2
MAAHSLATCMASRFCQLLLMLELLCIRLLQRCWRHFRASHLSRLPPLSPGCMPWMKLYLPAATPRAGPELSLLICSNACKSAMGGDCSSDYENGLQRIRDLTLPVNPQELLLVLQHLVKAQHIANAQCCVRGGVLPQVSACRVSVPSRATSFVAKWAAISSLICANAVQISSPPEGSSGRVFLFPLAAEACIKDCGNPSECAAVSAQSECLQTAGWISFLLRTHGLPKKAGLNVGLGVHLDSSRSRASRTAVPALPGMAVVPVAPSAVSSWCTPHARFNPWHAQHACVIPQCLQPACQVVSPLVQPGGQRATWTLSLTSESVQRSRISCLKDASLMAVDAQGPQPLGCRSSCLPKERGCALGLLALNAAFLIGGHTAAPSASVQDYAAASWLWGRCHAMEEIEAFHSAVQGQHHSQESSSQSNQARCALRSAWKMLHSSHQHIDSSASMLALRFGNAHFLKVYTNGPSVIGEVSTESYAYRQLFQAGSPFNIVSSVRGLSSLSSCSMLTKSCMVLSGFTRCGLSSQKHLQSMLCLCSCDHPRQAHQVNEKIIASYPMTFGNLGQLPAGGQSFQTTAHACSGPCLLMPGKVHHTL